MMFVYVLTDGNVIPGAQAGRMVESGIVFLVCLVTALPRFERPLSMILYGTLIIFLDMLVTACGYLVTDMLLPMASPVMGVFGSTAVLGIMAWNEEALRRARMESLASARVQFTDMLVHDLKKSISSVLMALSLIEKKSPPDEKEKELMIMMHAGVERMLLEVNNLLDIRKIEECGMHLSRETVELRGFLEEVIREHKPAAQIAGVDIRFEGEGRQEVAADRHILSRIMTNLIWNAIQHAPPATDIVVGLGVSGEMATLSVANRGELIPLYRQKMIFQAFHSNDLDVRRSRVNGTGLGLAFCKLAVEAHGGIVNLESPWSGFSDGVRIVVHLPCANMLR